MSIEIALSKQGKRKGQCVAIVDDCDADLASLRWSLQRTKHSCYAFRTEGKFIFRYAVLLHRIIAERMFGKDAVEGMFIDHINMNGLDNRRSNLRVATPSENAINGRIPETNHSGFKGVNWDKSTQKWHARIMHRNRRIHLGCFPSPESAARAYDKKAKELFGKFAKLNFPDSQED